MSLYLGNISYWNFRTQSKFRTAVQLDSEQLNYCDFQSFIIRLTFLLGTQAGAPIYDVIVSSVMFIFSL